MSELGRLTAVFDADTRRFDSGVRGVASKVVALEGSFRGLTGGASSAIGTLSGFAGPLSLAAGAAVVGATAIGGLVAGLWELTKSSAKVGGELFDLSQKTSLTVETLSGLSIVAKTTGSDINSITPSLVIFQKNMGAAQDATSKQGKLFRELSIDTRDNEKALRQAFTALDKYGDSQKAVELSTKLFGRSGKDVLAMIKETNGNLDAAIKKYEKMGLIIGTGAASASDKFNDVLEETTLQLEAVTRAIGMELLPVATDALRDISNWLKANKDTWKSWGETVANVLTNIKAVAQSELGQLILWLGKVAAAMPLAVNAAVAAGQKQGEDFFGPGGAARGGRASLPGTPEWLAAQRRLKDIEDNRIKLPGGSKGGGGGEDPAKTAERIASLQLEAVVNGLRAEQDANRRALELRRRDFNDYATQYMVIENRRHEAVVAGLDREQKAAERLKKGREIALQEISNKRTEENTTQKENRNRILDERARILDQIDKFLRDQDRDIARLTNTTDQWDQAYQQLVDTLKEEGVTLEENTRIRIESNNALARERELVLSVTRARQVLQSVRERVVTKAGRDRPPWIDLGGGSTVGGEPATTERPRIATIDEQVTRERLAKIREQMHELAGDLTSVFSQSISDGFNSGIKSGLQTLAQGLLQIVQDVFLRRMAQGLGDMLSGIAGGQGSGGGGFFSSLLRGIIGGVSGGLGGSIGGLGSASSGGVGTVFAGAIGRASGGPIWPNQLYKVHKDEYIMPTAPGLVIPKGGMGQTIINKHYTIQLPPDSRGSYNSPKSRRQLSENLIAALEASRS